MTKRCQPDNVTFGGFDWSSSGSVTSFNHMTSVLLSRDVSNNSNECDTTMVLVLQLQNYQFPFLHGTGNWIYNSVQESEL